MVKRAARVDENQPAIVKALRDYGCTVLILSSMGKGCPDLLVGNGRQNVLLEIKNPAKPKADRKLTKAEREWVESWRGPVHVVETITEALAVVAR